MNEQKFICKKCGNTEYIIKEKPNSTGVATGLYCAKCGTWQKWLNKQEKVLYGFEQVNTSELFGKIEQLKAENAELRARLDKAVELPCKVGDTVYCISPFNNNIDKGEIVCITVTKWMSKYRFSITVEGDQPLIYVEDEAIEPLGTYYQEDINETWFTNRAEAEKKLAELKGEN